MKSHESAGKPYAKALFALAKERGQTDAVARELKTIVDAVVADEGLQAFLARPWITAAAKRAVAVEVATRLEVSKLVRDFMALVAAQRRGDSLAAIERAYRELLDADLGQVRARVRTAVALTDAEKTMLATKLGRAFGGKRVILDEVIDRGMMGGFVAESGSVIVDGSLEGQLEQLRHRLATA